MHLFLGRSAGPGWLFLMSRIAPLRTPIGMNPHQEVPMRSPRLLALILAASACGARPLAKPDPVPEQETDVYLDVNPNRKLDLLVMVDNSSSMMNKQMNLANNFG